jgi:hypothetical protein
LKQLQPVEHDFHVHCRILPHSDLSNNQYIHVIMHISTVAMAALLAAGAAAQGAAPTTLDLNSIVQSEISVGASAESSIFSELGTQAFPTIPFPLTNIPPSLSSLIVSLSSEFRADVTNPSAVQSIESVLLGLTSAVGPLSTYASIQSSQVAASGSSGGAGASAASPSGAQGGSSSSKADAAPTAVVAGGVLAAAGLVVAVML